VIQELRWDTRVEAADVGVAVHDGVVTLAGTVESHAARLAAREAAFRVGGVRDVADELRVEIPHHHARSDEDIARAARNALEWNVLVPADAIHVTVADGWVTLDGTVATWRQRFDAEQALQHLPGVRGIVTKIHVNAPEVEASELRRAIEGALERRAEREARHLAVTVDGGTVTLTGTLRTWLDKQAVLGLVGHAPGVREVNDRIAIDPIA
jgi:osmotically-inducible protein OsmY